MGAEAKHRGKELGMKMRLIVGRVTALVCIAALARTGGAASLTVTSNLDAGAGSLREAITTANGNGEADTITFSGNMTITLGNSMTPITAGDTTIDGGTNTVTLTGTTARSGFVLTSVSNCVIRNIRATTLAYGVQIDGGSNNTVEGCTLQSNTYPIAMWNGSTQNKVRGCTIESNTNGIQIGSSATASSNNTIGGTTASLGNRISGHSTTNGIFIVGTGSNNNLIIGNKIGVNNLGTAAQANSVGIEIFRGANNIIGGTTAGERNIISGNAVGVRVRQSQATGNQIIGNYIGLAEDGVTLIPNLLFGVRCQESSQRTTIGGATTAHGNVIVKNTNGISIDTSTRNSILRNSIYLNTNTAIQLLNNGNNNVAAPVITQVNPITGTVTTTGTVQLFVDDASQGKIFIDSVTAASGTFTSSASLAAYEGKNLTAILTDNDATTPGDSSVFSAPKLIDVTPPSSSISTADAIVVDNNIIVDVAAPTDNFTASANVQMRFSNDGATWSSFETYSATKAWDLYFGITPVKGPHTVYAQFRDDALNVSAPSTTTVEIDNTPPAGGFSLGASVVTDAAVNLTIDPPTDNNTAAAAIEMRFSNDGTNWSAYEAYQPTKAWDLNLFLTDTSDGIRNVYMQLRDEAQSESTPYTITVELDTTGPQIVDFSILDGTPTLAAQVRFSITFDERVLQFETGSNPNNDSLALDVFGALTGAGILGITDEGANTFTITVGTGIDSGLIVLNIMDLGTLTDEHGNPFAGGGTAGPYVVDRLEITQHPVGGTPTEEDAFTFTVAAEKAIGVKHYEWRKDGQPIPTAPDSPTYTINATELEDSGDYTVAVIDDYRFIESDIAHLQVLPRIPVASGAGIAALAAAIAGLSARTLRRKR